MFDSDDRLTIPAILNPSETYDVADKILSAADGVVPADPATLERKQLDKLTELTRGLAAAVGKGRAEDPPTQVKADADAKRDSGFVRLKNAVNEIVGDHQEDDQAAKDAATVIKRVLAEYPANLHATSLDQNTLLLDSLIPKLRAEPAASAVATLGLTRFVDRMHEGNEQFKQADEASAAGRAEEVPRDWAAAKQVRWHGSVLATNLGFLGATEEAYAPLAAQVRQFIDDAEAKARGRRSRRENEGADDTQEPPPEPPSE